MKLLDAKRNRKPRLKPGITFTRLIAFLVGFVVLAVIAHHFVEGHFPSAGDCGSKEIDTGPRKEGTCTEGGSTIVVVDRGSVLRLESLEARLMGTRERKTITGPAGSKTAKGRFVTFGLAVTNRSDAPAAVALGQFWLYVGGLHSEAAEVDGELEPRSFLARDRTIPPGGTEDGTVTFGVSAKGAKSLAETGNLDVVNLGSPVSIYEPEALFSSSEYGAIRTYK